MQTLIHARLADSEPARAADTILRSCVHCGFCLAVCPTYLITGDESDSPRGRIYLIKNMLEQDRYPASTRTHLDRCLTCRACETVCPSGVEYASLLDIGRSMLDLNSKRGFIDRTRRWLIVRVLSNPRLFRHLLDLGRKLKPALPRLIQRLISEDDGNQRDVAGQSAEDTQVAIGRRMLILEGCVQSELSPAVNVWLHRLLARKGIELESIAPERCCGALAYHTGMQADGLQQVKSLIDFYWGSIEAGVEQIVFSASGCGVFIKDYGELLADEPEYAGRARAISARCADASEVIAREYADVERAPNGTRLAWHSPCTLQHGLRVDGEVEKLLVSVGFELVPVQDATTCCGSAGSYSLLETGLAGQLQTRKIAALTVNDPQLIVTANVGCQFHLASVADIPVRHWIEVYAERVLSDE